jgi:pyruvate,water dikinase
VEYFPVPLYHFDASFLPPLIASVSRLASEFGLRGSSAAQIFVEHPDGSLGPGFQAPAPRLSTLFAMLRLPAVLWRTAAVDPLTAMERPRAEILGRATELKRLPMARLHDAAVVQVVRDSQELLARAFEARKAFFLGAWWLTFALDALLRLLHGRRGPEIAADLRAGLSHQTASMNQTLRDLQRMSHTAPPAAFAAAVEDFIERYGCRTERPIPVPSARPWADDPDHVRRLLDRFDVPVRRASSRADEHRLFARAYRSSLRRARRWRALRCDRVLPFLVRRNRSLWLERDWTILTYERAVAPARTAMREIGTRLCQRGALRSWSDVRHLSIEEATFALAGAHSPEDTRRRVDHRRAGRRRTVQRWSEAISAATTSRANRGVVLRGTAASPGLATAHASLVLSDRDMDGVRPGDILVCRSTGPSWTPLFGSVAGVVTDLGGPLSHAAIVAREYGIPAVIGTGNATSVLRHDRVYSVDGSAGEVRGGTRSSRGHSQ